MSLRSETGRPRSTTLSASRNFRTGRTGRCARQIESTQYSLAASEPFKWTLERHSALILEAVGVGC